MHNARIRLLVLAWCLLPWVGFAAGPPPAIVRSVLTTNLPGFGNVGQALFRTAGLPYLNWSNVTASAGGDMVLSNYVVAVSNLQWQSDNIVSNWVNAVSNRVDGGFQASTNYAAGTANNVSNWVNAVSNYVWASDNVVSNWVIARTNFLITTHDYLVASNNVSIGANDPTFPRLLTIRGPDPTAGLPPLFGQSSEGFIRLESITDPLFNMQMGIDQSHLFGFLQVGLDDSFHVIPSYYMLCLNPYGGQVGIGTRSTTSQLDVPGVTTLGTLYATNLGGTLAGKFIGSSSGLGTNTQIYGSSGGTNWWIMTTNGPLMTNTASSFTLIRNGQINTSSNVNADHFSVSNTPVLRSLGAGNEFFGSYTGTNLNDQSAGKSITLIGYRSGASLSTNVNSSIYAGFDCGLNVTQASYNTIVGVAAAQYLQNDGNVMMGHHAGRLCSNTSQSVLIGEGAGEYGTNGTQSAIVGAFSAATNSGTGTVTLGYLSGKNLIQGNYSVMIGWQSGLSQRASDNSTFIGADAGHFSTGANNTFVGVSSGYNSKSGQNNTFVGIDSGFYNNAGSDNIFLGLYNTDSTGSNLFNTFIAGGPGHAMTNVFFGEGPADATPLSYTINGTAGTGTDIAGAHISLAGGKSTGMGAGGEIRFFTSPTNSSTGATTNQLIQRGEFTSSGYFGVGTNSAQSALHVTADNSAANMFQFGTTNRAAMFTGSTNGVLTVNPGNTGSGPIVLGAFGNLKMSDTNIVQCPGADIYTNACGTNFTSIATNGFYGAVGPGDSAALTNLYAGWYRVQAWLSYRGANATSYEVGIFTNLVECSELEFKDTFDTPARERGNSIGGTIYLPAGCRTSLKIKDYGAGTSIAVTRVSLNIGTP